jgi:hypothetical protein
MFLGNKYNYFFFVISIPYPYMIENNLKLEVKTI